MMVEAGSALSKEVKMATLADEISRRLRTTSLEVEHSCRLEILERACVKMKTSGHVDPFIRQAVEQGIRAFEEKVRRSKLEDDHPGYQPLFPKAGWKKDLKSKEKALKRGNWFKGSNDKEEGWIDQDWWSEEEPLPEGWRQKQAQEGINHSGVCPKHKGQHPHHVTER